MQLRLGVPPGSAVWYQFVAKLQELGYRYDQFKPVNIQGAAASFVQAMQRGDVDAIIQAEPTESMPEMGGYGFFRREGSIIRTARRPGRNWG